MQPIRFTGTVKKPDKPQPLPKLSPTEQMHHLGAIDLFATRIENLDDMPVATEVHIPDGHFSHIRCFFKTDILKTDNPQVAWALPRKTGEPTEHYLEQAFNFIDTIRTVFQQKLKGYQWQDAFETQLAENRGEYTANSISSTQTQKNKVTQSDIFKEFIQKRLAQLSPTEQMDYLLSLQAFQNKIGRLPKTPISASVKISFRPGEESYIVEELDRSDYQYYERRKTVRRLLPLSPEQIDSLLETEDGKKIKLLPIVRQAQGFSRWKKLEPMEQFLARASDLIREKQAEFLGTMEHYQQLKQKEGEEIRNLEERTKFTREWLATLCEDRLASLHSQIQPKLLAASLADVGVSDGLLSQLQKDGLVRHIQELVSTDSPLLPDEEKLIAAAYKQGLLSPPDKK